MSSVKIIIRENHPEGSLGITIHDAGNWKSFKRWTNPPEETMMMVK